ncbi:hypothetical protein L615_002100000380 [Nocardioides sp. J9]|nr:hypothetical protein L615_002100000380 [Nocardioides sp. J9]
MPGPGWPIGESGVVAISTKCASDSRGSELLSASRTEPCHPRDVLTSRRTPRIGAEKDLKTYDDRIASLNGENGLRDESMQRAVAEALEPGEVPRALYSVNAHIWVEAVLTDRALLVVKGAFRPRAHRVPFPLDLVRGPRGSKRGARLKTPLGNKTLWGSTLDPRMEMLVAAAGGGAVESARAVDVGATAEVQLAPPTADVAGTPDAESSADVEKVRLSWRERVAARRRAGKKPKKPKPQKARAEWVGAQPSSTIWELAYNCVKCGRPLTNPESQRHRVGTDCIKRCGSQARRIENPEFSAWTARKARAEVDRVARQVELDAEHARAMTAYEDALARWQRVRSGAM